jgi:hypothetical protein
MLSEKIVLETLERQPKPVKAKELTAPLSKVLRVAVVRRDVNRILYALREKGFATVDERFFWTVGGKRTPSDEERPAANGEQSRPTYYDVLEIARHAGLDVIQKAYRALALRSHPDRAEPSQRRQAEERMKLINEAFEVLSDPKKRAAYDRATFG